jgi:ATPase subunit of ABC transporter with duplicated ATPase domains
MTTLSLGQAAGLTGRGKTILARAISGRLFAGSKEEDGDSNLDGAESARVYPFPAPVETVAELRTRLTLAEERLSELKAMLEDMRSDRDAWREQAQTRLLSAPAARMRWWPWRRAAG